VVPTTCETARFATTVTGVTGSGSPPTPDEEHGENADRTVELSPQEQPAEPEAIEKNDRIKSARAPTEHRSARYVPL
jgi:hypothetical protein